MKDPRQRYLEWTPDNTDYTRDDAIISVGLKSSITPLPLSDVRKWLGNPDKSAGSTKVGNIVYYFDNQDDTVAMFDITDGMVNGFGIITRNKDNALRKPSLPGEAERLNILDEMEDYSDSEMKKSTEPAPPPYSSPAAGSESGEA
jgi:hypothetical protein